MPFQKLRERINLFLYGNKTAVLSIARVLNVVISLGAVFVLAYYYGYSHTTESEAFLMNLIKFSFAFYVFHYLVRFVYDFKPWEFIRRTWFEGLVMFLLTVEAVSYNFFDVLLLERLARGIGFESFTDVSAIFIQLYMFVVVLIGIGRGGAALPRIKLNPALIFLFIFGSVILIGTGLLMLPEMTTGPGSMNFLDALFTSTSASCVTGLMTVDASEFFTFKGQMVLLGLMKLGGLNIIAFGSFLAIASRFGIQAQQHEVLEDFVNKDSILSSSGMLGKVILWSTGIELLGGAFLFMLWGDGLNFTSTGERAFFSVFHSVSAFNNAGISLFSSGFMEAEVVTNWMLQWGMIGIMFLGALGMVAIFELFDPAALRDRMRYPWKRLSFMSRIALNFAIGLTVLGTVFMYVFEGTGTLQGSTGIQQFTHAVFQSVTTRTAGFNTVDFGAMGIPMILIVIMLMFIGSASSSTGGGIKTSTFAVILADVIATVKRTPHTILYKRTIPQILKSRAYAVLMFFIIMNLIGVLVLSISETAILAMSDRSLVDLMFEQVSAMSTVGLSTGITAALSDSGKTWIIVSMFVGRVGTLTVAYALGIKVISNNYKYANGHTMIG